VLFAPGGGLYVAGTGLDVLSPLWGRPPMGILPGVWALPVGLVVLVDGLLFDACLLAFATRLTL